jgi:DNA-binding helix-hairpin-helix protein with protein kinase domain
MNQILKLKQTVRAVNSNLDVVVNDYIGGGGQGEVYRATMAGKETALKWYFPNTATDDQREILENLVRIGPPDRRFLWPLDVAESADVKGFGYVMPLRDERHKSIVDLMKRKTEPTFRALCNVGFQLADSFLTLHSKGLSYRDISFGNVFFDPETGDALVCDNDNVSVDGSETSGVVGTPRFMAPEIVRGEAKPSKQTDLFSLSVLLFYIFMVHHPLEGKREKSIKCLDLPAMNKLYGEDPLFVFDPDDESNRPEPGVHDNALLFWRVYPGFLKALFTKAFTEGLRDPQDGRVAESVWRMSMIRLRDAIMYCPNCVAENFFDEEMWNASEPQHCWRCDAKIQAPPRLKTGDALVALNFDSKLYPHHLGDLYNFEKPVAELARHPKNPNRWGLKNVGSGEWTMTKPDGSSTPVPPGKSVGVARDVEIDFGGATGVIMA